MGLDRFVGSLADRSRARPSVPPRNASDMARYRDALLRLGFDQTRRIREIVFVRSEFRRGEALSNRAAFVACRALLMRCLLEIVRNGPSFARKGGVRFAGEQCDLA